MISWEKQKNQKIFLTIQVSLRLHAPLKGLGITFIITGLMALGFMSFMGIKL